MTENRGDRVVLASLCGFSGVCGLFAVLGRAGADADSRLFYFDADILTVSRRPASLVP
jgi:hypothetical protein